MEINPIPKDYEEVSYKDLSLKENEVLELSKSSEYDIIVPEIISSKHLMQR